MVVLKEIRKKTTKQFVKSKFSCFFLLNFRNAPPSTGAPPQGGDPYRGYPGTPGTYPPPPQRPYNQQQPTPNAASATPPTSGAPPQNPPGSPYPPPPQQFEYRPDQVCSKMIDIDSLCRLFFRFFFFRNCILSDILIMMLYPTL